MKRSKQLLKIVMPAIAIICTLIFTPWQIFWMWMESPSDTVQEQVINATNHGLNGVIVYINQQGKAPAFYSAGWDNSENKVQIDPHALFKIASISKLYIAVATAKLINSNRLSLDATLAELLPELSNRIENADKITLKMLLQHRSGIPDWINDEEFPWGNPPTNVNKILDLVLDEPAKFKPDGRHDYSNTNYLLIGNILDKTLGYSHQLYIKTEILDPLSLTHTFGNLSDVNVSNVVSGYDTHFEGDVKALDFVAPGSSMIATAEDVGIFLRALNNGSLLNEAEQKIYSSIYEFEHTGLLPGYQSIARYHKDIDAVVIQFVNDTGGNKWTKAEIIYNRIIKILKKDSSE